MLRFSLPYKITISLVFAILTIFGAWYLSHTNFKKIKSTVEQLSQPNREQVLINELFKDIVVLDQLQRNQVYQPKDLVAIEDKKQLIHRNIDSLKVLNETDSTQLARIALVENLLGRRAHILNEFINYRIAYHRSDSTQTQIDRLSQFVRSLLIRGDSGILKTQSSISSTTVADTLPANTKSNFWDRLFGKRKEPAIKEVKHFILERLNVSVDTLQLMQDDSMVVHLSHKLEDLQQNRKQQQKALSQKRVQLDIASAKLIHELLLTLNSIEQEERTHTQSSNTYAVNIIEGSLRNMQYLIAAFVLIILVLAVLIYNDIARSNRYRRDLILAKEEAEELSKVKERFLSNMSHELRSPLQSIIGYTELELLKKEDTQSENLKIVAHSSRHLLDVVNQILDFSKLSSGKLELQNQPFSLSVLLKELKDIISYPVAAKKLELQWQQDTAINDRLMVVGDALRLKQVLLNLLHNAIKFTEKGRIAFKAAIDDRGGEHCAVHFIVEDTGMGIRKEDLRLIFNDFEQLQNGQVINGTGLGLSIVKDLLTQMGGTIQVVSELNKGTRFSIDLQLPGYYTSATTQVVPEAPRDITNKGLVWVVDDDPFILQFCRSVLEHYHIPFRTFNNPKELIMADIPDTLSVVYMDIRMPEINGFETVRQWKNKLAHRKIPVVAITAQILADNDNRARFKDFEDILSKPFTIRDFTENIARYCTTGTEATIQDPDIEPGLQALFVEETQKDIQSLETAVTKADMQSIRDTVHKLSSRLGQMQLYDLYKPARHIELQLKSGRMPLQSLQELIDKLKDKCRELAP